MKRVLFVGCQLFKVQGGKEGEDGKVRRYVHQTDPLDSFVPESSLASNRQLLAVFVECLESSIQEDVALLSGIIELD